MMHYKIYTCLLFLACLANCSSSPAERSPEEKEIYALFEQYEKSILEQDGELFVQLIDDNTKRYFAKTLEIIRTYDRAQLESHLARSNYPLMEKLMIFTSRANYPTEVIRQISPEEFVMHNVNLNSIDNNYIDRTYLKQIDHIAGNGAVGMLATKVTRKINITGRIEFNKIDGVWKIDLTSRLRSQNKFLKMFCREKGVHPESIDCIKAFIREFDHYELEEDKIWSATGVEEIQI